MRKKLEAGKETQREKKGRREEGIPARNTWRERESREGGGRKGQEQKRVREKG